MARSCTCKLCKKKLTTDTAYKISNGKTNNYYCSKEEYDNYLNEKGKRDSCYKTIIEILESPIITPMMKKEVNELNQFYDFIVIERTFKEYENNIKWFLENKSDGSEYAKTKYIMAIIKNNINSTYKKYIQEQKQIEKLFNKANESKIEVDIINDEMEKPVVERKVNDISSFLD